MNDQAVRKHSTDQEFYFGLRICLHSLSPCRSRQERVNLSKVGRRIQNPMNTNNPVPVILAVCAINLTAPANRL